MPRKVILARLWCLSAINHSSCCEVVCVQKKLRQQHLVEIIVVQHRPLTYILQDFNNTLLKHSNKMNPDIVIVHVIFFWNFGKREEKITHFE